MPVKAAFAVTLTVRCVKCRATRELPDADRSRWPAVDARGGLTLQANETCRCGSSRVRVSVKL